MVRHLSKLGCTVHYVLTAVSCKCMCGSVLCFSSFAFMSKRAADIWFKFIGGRVNGPLSVIRHMQYWPPDSLISQSFLLCHFYCLINHIHIQNESNLSRGTSAPHLRVYDLITFPPSIHFWCCFCYLSRCFVLCTKSVGCRCMFISYLSCTNVQIYLYANGPTVCSLWGKSGPGLTTMNSPK